MKIALAKIRLDGGTQPRAELNAFVVDEYAAARASGAEFPRVTVFYDGTDYWLADGFHRVGAEKQIGSEKIDADVKQGTQRDAILFSCGANSTHGLPRTNADKRRAVTTILSDKAWCKRSDNWVAGQSCTTQPFVRKVRAELITVIGSSASREGKDGKTRRLPQSASSRLAPATRALIASTAAAESREDVTLLARLPESTQREVAQRIASGQVGDVRSGISALRREDRVEKIVAISKGETELTGALGRFPILYADPPWRYEHVETESRAIENQYPTMELDSICALPIQEIATPDAVLFMWATSPKLAEAMRVLESWGFTYRTCMVWVKPQLGMGYYARQKHELLLIATRGNPPTPLPANRPDSVLVADRTKHSAKPHEFYEVIERMYPELKKLELFCRSPRTGWSVWGNQAGAAA